MNLYYDYLLVKEIVEDTNLEGTSLKIKYDDTERYMKVQIVQRSEMLIHELYKMYSSLDTQTAKLIDNTFKIGAEFIINRAAKTPYKDGLYFISIKDIISKV